MFEHDLFLSYTRLDAVGVHIEGALWTNHVCGVFTRRENAGHLQPSCSYDATVKLWDTRTGQEMASLKGDLSIVSSVGFSRDGKMLAVVSFNGAVRLWRAATTDEVARQKNR